MCENTHKHKWVCVRRENQIDPLELEVEAIVSHHVGVVNYTRVFGECGRTFLSNLSVPK